MTTPVVLCVGAGALQVPLLREAKASGLHVVATDGNPEAPGASVADTFAPIDTYDAQGHVALVSQLQAQGHQIRGVVTAGADVAPTVAAAAEAAGVPGIPVAVAARSHNKAAVRQALDGTLACYQPAWMEWVPWRLPSDVPEEIAGTIGFPCVLKPLQQRASRGISIVHDPASLSAALEKVRVYGDTFLVETYHRGTEHSVEAILGETDLLWFNVVDRVFTYRDGIPLEIGHVNPSKLSLLQHQRLEAMLRLIARTLGVTWGPFKIDVLWTNEGPLLLEATCRLSGGWDCQRTSPLTGRYPLKTLLQLACQLPLEPVCPPVGYAACAAILPEATGVVTRLPALASSRHCPRYSTAILDALFWAVAPGDRIQPPAHCAERAGFVTTWAPTYEAAWGSASTNAARLATTMELR